MSTINKLSIRGIRSFGTSKEDEQKITFECPLTLIVGENGCGKTTVVECLKYALTGEMPPGSDKGKTFVHDPKVFRNSSSLGQVKLQVTDPLGRSKTCIRSLSLDVQKNGKSTFKTLDSTVISDKAGKKEESGRRVEDVNNEMAGFMGVSKAILNNVIFCHQEDSSWPLDEAKKLKDKFDAIFGTTEYNKAIDKLIKFRKKYDDDLKSCHLEKRFKIETKSDADRKRLELEKQIEKREKMLADVEKLKASIEPLNKKLEQILTKEQEFGTLHGQKAIFEATIRHCDANAENTKSRIKSLMNCGIEELEKLLKTFEETRKKNETELRVLTEEKDKITEDEKKLEANIIQANAKVSAMSDQLGKLQDLQSKRGQDAKLLAEQLEISHLSNVETQEITTDDIITLVETMNQAIVDKVEALKDVILTDEANDVEFQQQIDQIREQKTSAETNLKTQRERIASLNKGEEKLRAEIQSIEKSLPKINELVSKIEVAEKKLEKCKAEINVDDLQDQKDFIETDKNELEIKLDAVEKDVETLDSISKITNELEIKQRELSQNQNDFDRTKSKNSSTFKFLMPSKTVDRNFKIVVQVHIDDLKREIDLITVRTDEVRIKKTRLQTQRESLRGELRHKQRDLTEITERIEKLCDGRDYMDLLSSQKDKVEKLTMELAYHQSSDATFKHYKEEIDQEPCCPLCHKNLNAKEGEDLKEDIDEKIRQLPRRIADTEKKRKVEATKYDELNQARSSYDSIEKLKVKISSLIEEIKRLDDEYQQNNDEIENLELQIVEPKSKQESITSTFISDMSRLDELTKSIEVKTKEVAALKAQLPNKMPQKSLVDTKAEFKQLLIDVKTKNELMNQLNKQINDYQAKTNSLQDEFNKLVSEKVKHQEKLQGLDQMKSQMKKIEQEQLELENKIKSDDQKLAPLKEKLVTLTQQKENSKSTAKQRVDKLQKEIDKFKLSHSDVVRLNNEIEEYENLDLENKINSVMLNIDGWSKRCVKLKNFIKQKSEEIENLSKEVNNQEGSFRNLQDNMELRKIEMEKQKAEQDLHKMRKQMGELNPRKLMEEKASLIQKREKMTAEQQTISGQMNELNDRIASAEKEVNEPKYKDAHRNLMREIYKENVLKAAIDDLNKYRAALEKSLLKFHADKMKEINEMIRDLWNTIYKGNDIDYIMIKTDEDDAKTTSGKKRSYNYRVVQAKNGGSEIDMRGRCSAGQKVLASLIIRMALAETFSANCKILALDEPTTNLDQNNIQALCSALGQIVEEREKTGNFMLIVITHDEHFVNSLERAEHYFKLSRDANGRSRISKVQNL